MLEAVNSPGVQNGFSRSTKNGACGSFGKVYLELSGDAAGLVVFFSFQV